MARDLEPESATESKTTGPGAGSTPPKYKPGCRAGHHAVTTRADDVELTAAFDAHGLVSDWELFEGLLNHALRNELRVDPREHALLLADPNHNGRKQRERLTEVLFEKFELPAVYLSRSAVLSCYASGRTTGLVLDVGYSGTSAVPVEDGAIVNGRFIRTRIGGKYVNEVLSAVLQERDVRLRPLWSYRRRITGVQPANAAAGGAAVNLLMLDADAEADGLIGNGVVRRSRVDDLSFPRTTDSFWDFARLRLLEEVKAGLCCVAEAGTVPNSSNNAASLLPGAVKAYELPDGNVIQLGPERFQVAEETVFGKLPHTLLSATGAGALDAKLSYVNKYVHNRQAAGSTADASAGPASSDGLAGLVVDAIKMCDQAVHRDLYAGVCLTGGTSDMDSLYERLNAGLVEKYHKVRILAAAGSNERKYCGWTGGSILATFSEHQKNWLSRSEFDENGSSFIHRKCQ